VNQCDRHLADRVWMVRPPATTFSRSKVKGVTPTGILNVTASRKVRTRFVFMQIGGLVAGIRLTYTNVCKHAEWLGILCRSFRGLMLDAYRIPWGPRRAA
jgi:hypothetical protein